LPPLNPPSDIDPLYDGNFEDYAVEIHEWFSLISLNSPRINPEDNIDPFLSRYATPGESNTRSKFVKVTWRGFLTPTWVHKTFMETLLAAPRDAWFAYSAVGFGEGWSGDSKDCTILKPPDAPNEYVMWEIAQ
jgi:ribonuclease P/MRP protein subunit RPP40